jgi:GTPase involved in cell partitioning and DNA repair
LAQQTQQTVWVISAVARTGLEPLLQDVWQALETQSQAEQALQQQLETDLQTLEPSLEPLVPLV